MTACSKVRRYNLTMLITGVLLGLLFLVVATWGGRGTWALNDLAALPLKGDHAFYRDLGGRNAPELQDLDLFYHNIGPSIDAARSADIILLGPSFVLYGLDPELLRQFGDKHGIKIFNMAFFGIRSGEFSREIIRKWSLRPKLWIINVDDQFDAFFSDSKKMWWFRSYAVPIPPFDYDRMKAWATVAKRNVRWRIEDFRAAPSTGGPAKDNAVYRRFDDGSVYLDNDGRYGSPDNKPFPVVRDPDCHTTPAIVASGKDYLAAIGGEAVLILVPNSTTCPQQAVELGQQLGRDVVLPDVKDLSSVDGGGHLDRRGAIAYTRALLRDLETTAAFAAIIKAKPRRSAAAD